MIHREPPPALPPPLPDADVLTEAKVNHHQAETSKKQDDKYKKRLSTPPRPFAARKVVLALTERPSSCTETRHDRAATAADANDDKREGRG
jgi:hypothetical protein